MTPQDINNDAAISKAIVGAIKAAFTAVAAAGAMTVKDVAGSEGITLNLGLVPVSLREPAMMVQPEDTWFENNIPKVSPETHPGMRLTPDFSWKAIIEYNQSGKSTSAEGKRAGKINRTTKTFTGTMKKVGVDDSITYEMNVFGSAFKVDPMREKSLIAMAKRARERRLIGATNIAIASPAGGTISGTPTAGGTMTATTWKAQISSYSHFGFLSAQATGFQGGNNGVSNTDGESVAGTASAVVTTAAANLSITWSWTDIDRAFGYGVFTQSGGAGTFKFTAFTDRNYYLQTADPTSTHTPNTSDLTADVNDFEGIIPQLLGMKTITVGANTYQGTYVRSLDSAAWAGDSRGGIQQITDALTRQWKERKAAPKYILFGTDAFVAASSLIVANVPPNILAQVQLQLSNGNMIGGLNSTFLRHPVTGALIEMIVHWGLPPRWVVGVSFANPMEDPDYPNTVELLMARDWERFFFAQTQLEQESGIYSLCGPAVSFPAGFFVLKNVSTS